MVAADALQTSLGRFEIQSQSRRAVHGKSDASEPQGTTKAGIQRLSLMCKPRILSKWKKRRRGVFEKMAHQTLSKKASNHNPYIPLETCLKNGPTS